MKSVEASDPGLDLGAITQASGAVAGIRVDPGDVVELWVGPREGRAPVHETVKVDARRGWSAAAVAALEALRARLLEIRSEPDPGVAPLAAAPVLPDLPPAPPAPPPRPWLWVHLAAGVDASPGGLAPAFDGLLEVRVEPRPWLSLGGFGAFTPLATQLEAPEGKATVRHAIAGVAIEMQKHLSRASFSIGVGGAVIPTLVQGTSPSAGYGARDASTLALAPLLRASSSIEIAPPLRIRLSLAAGVTFPESTITFADREVATWGRPFGLLTLGLEGGAGR